MYLKYSNFNSRLVGIMKGHIHTPHQAFRGAFFMNKSSILEKAYKKVEETLNRSFPFKERGIIIDRSLIEAAMTILNACPTKELPQNSLNAIRERTPDGLDRRIKDYLQTNLRTANIISDILAVAGIVEITQAINPHTGRQVKGTRLLEDWHWGHEPESSSWSINIEISPVKQGKKTKSSRSINQEQMNREQYLNSTHVKEFILWLDSRLDLPGSFKHEYYLKKARRYWSCSCLFEAYTSYWWPFNMVCLLSNQRVAGTDMDISFSYLNKLAHSFRLGVHEENSELAKKCALAMLQWGGVLHSNKDRIDAMGQDICFYFQDVCTRLDLSTVTLENHHGILMNSGFTKLYFLLIDDFIMYDGRVGAALGLLVRKFCEEQGLSEIPPAIQFSYGPGREVNSNSKKINRRNPSAGIYHFPQFSHNRRRHINDNIKASWLLKELSLHTESRFKELPQSTPLNERVTALQSALFMIGYDVSRN